MDERFRCTAKAKTTGERCRRARAAGRKVCAFHGGKTPRGPASPHWKDGSRSRSLPKRMLEDYQRAINDPQRYTFEENIGALEALAGELFRKLARGESPEQIKLALEAAERAREAIEKDEPKRAFTQLMGVYKALDDGRRLESAQRLIRDELLRVLSEIRKTVDSEFRRQHREREVVTKEQLVVVQARMLEIITKHVRDRKVLVGIAEDFEREANRWGSDPDAN